MLKEFCLISNQIIISATLKNEEYDVEKYKKRLDELLNNANNKVTDYYTKHPEEISIYSTSRRNEIK